MRFELYRRGVLFPQWRWRLRAANGEPIASGEGYWNRKDALGAIALVMGSGGAKIDDLTKEKK